jgi:CubicO group peptidase (beta-lactamase class C family)
MAAATLACPFGTSSTPAADPRAGPDRAADVDRIFAKWDRSDSPGCAVGIVRGGELIYAKGFGTANLETEVPNTPQTIFEIASASKSFTCACIALLMDQGKIQPEDDLARFVPEMHKFDPPVRVRHMVQCRSGLWEPVHIMPLAGWANLPVHSPFSESDLLTVLCGQRTLPFEPGTRFHYGSGDYYFLGLIVKRVTGKSLAEFARERLFEPLGMTRTHYEEDPTLVVKGRAVGHYREQGIWHQWRVNAYLAGGGGVKTCVEDLVRWDRNFDDSRLPRGKYMDEFIREGTLLGNRYVLDADAYRKHVQKGVQNPPAGRYRGLKRIQFTGGVWGMTAAIARFPEQRFTVICLSNNDEVSPFAKTREIAELYLADAMEPVSATASPADEPADSPELPPDELRNKVGAFRLLDEGRIWEVAIREGDLHVIDPVNKAWRLKPLTATRFRPVGDTPFYKSARFHFRREAPDQPWAMTLESNENGFREVLEFRRVDLVDPPPDRLIDYAGDYLNDELSATYRFAVKDGALCLRVGSHLWERLDPTVCDEFIPHVRTLHDNRIITFRRDGNHRVIGFTIAFWRVKSLTFQKQSPGGQPLSHPPPPG